MGAAIASSLLRAAGGPTWSQYASGPTLRMLFGGYGAPDCWAVLRACRQVDDGSGFIGYDELQQVVSLADCSQLFLWDWLSQHGELINTRELMVAVIVFSSARLEEKARILMSVFDVTRCGVCTGAEIAEMCGMVLNTLGRCTHTVVKPKDVSLKLKAELHELLPEFRERVRRYGRDAVFDRERLVGHSELDALLLPTIRPQYDRLPIAGPQPADSARPPPAQSRGGGGPAVRVLVQVPQSPVRAKRVVPVRPLHEGLSHLAWMDDLEEAPRSADACQLPTLDDDPWEIPDAAELAAVPARRWMVIHSVDFGDVARDIAGFSRLFAKSVAAALGLPPACVEVLNVTQGSIVVEFLLRLPARSANAHSLALLLEQQLQHPHSALRRGQLALYAAGAELLAGEPQRVATPQNQEPRAPPVQVDQAVQVDPRELELPKPPKLVRRTRSKALAAKDGGPDEEGDVVARVRSAILELGRLRHRAAEAEAALAEAGDDARRRKLLIEELRGEAALLS